MEQTESPRSGAAGVKGFLRRVLTALAVALALFSLLGTIVGLTQNEMGMTGFFAVLFVIAFLCFRKLRGPKKKKVKAKKSAAPVADDVKPDPAPVQQAQPAPEAQVVQAPAPTPASKPAKAKKEKPVKEKKPSPWEIDYVVVAGQESRAKAGSAVARGAVGGFLLGPVGWLAGGSAKRNTTVTLVVRYKSGRVKNVQCKLNSSEFKKYSKYIR